MPRTLTDVLREYAVKHHAEFEGQRARKEEWLAAIGRLLEQLRGWLREADKDGVLRIDPEVYDIGEEALGWYEAPGLTVYLGSRQVKIKPVGRATTGRRIDGASDGLVAEGRVDLRAGAIWYMLFRSLAEGGESWHLVAPESFKAIPLTRESFDEAMARLFE
jgi:hypothetical protein